MQQQRSDSEARPDRPRWFGFAQLALIFLVIAVALYLARAPDRLERNVITNVASDLGMPTVRVIQPASTEQALTLRVTGTVRVEQRVMVVSEVGGRVVWVSPQFRNGGTIAANETFVRIDPAELQLEVEAAEMSVREAEARLRMEEDRMAEIQGERPENDVAPAVVVAEAELGKAQAALKLAELRLARTDISLPYDIRVVTSDAEVGELVGPAEFVGPQAVLGVVYRIEALQVEAPVEPTDLESLAPAIGRSAEIQTWAGVYAAQVVRASSIVAPQTRLRTLFLKFADGISPESLPLPGTFVEVSIAGAPYENVYVLPESVVQEGDSVWIVQGGLLTSFAPSALGRTDAGWVVEAFDAGEGVVIGTVPGAREGLAVAATVAGSQG